MDRNHGDNASAWDVVANATSLHRRSADTRERGWYVRYGSKADITARSRHVRFSPDSGHSSARGMSEKCHKPTSGLYQPSERLSRGEDAFRCAVTSLRSYGLRLRDRRLGAWTVSYFALSQGSRRAPPVARGEFNTFSVQCDLASQAIEASHDIPPASFSHRLDVEWLVRRKVSENPCVLS